MTPERAYAYLARALEAERMAQAYVVVGNPKTVGAGLAVRLLCRILCTASGDRPCGRCPACHQVQQHTHADTLWVEPLKKSRQIAVEQVREVLKRVQQTAYVGRWKLCVMSAADRLGREAANAFLKTLEEPAGQTLFLLLTDTPQTLLPTILSRCQLLTLDTDEIGVSEWDRQLLAILSSPPLGGGLLASLGQSERLAALFGEMKKTALKDVEAEAEAEGVELDEETRDARAGARFREMRTAAMRTMLAWYRDRLILVCGGSQETLKLRDHLEVLHAQVRALSRTAALRHVRVVEDMHEQFERNLPDGVVLGSGLPSLYAG